MCYSTKEELKERQKQIQEAVKRDHKKIGKEMELYMSWGQKIELHCQVQRLSAGTLTLQLMVLLEPLHLELAHLKSRWFSQLNVLCRLNRKK